MESYVPKVVENHITGVSYGEMLVELNKCHKCNKLMIVKSSNRFTSTFPHYFRINFDAQIKNAGWVTQSNVKVDDKYICEECVENGKADFECYVCKKRHSIDLIKESFGDPADYLCQKCYEIVPAKEWRDIVDKLDSIHRYDFE